MFYHSCDMFLSFLLSRQHVNNGIENSGKGDQVMNQSNDNLTHSMEHYLSKNTLKRWFSFNLELTHGSDYT